MIKNQKFKINSTFTNELPADKNRENRPRQVEEACFSFVKPVIPKKPVLLHSSEVLKVELGLDNLSVDQFLALMTGQTQFEGMESYAMCYGGHQFGNWAGQLGDGRAINIAEIEYNNNRNVLQLKGSGPTPYSRGADGFAVLRSSIREYLMSEAMYNLGISTTRALSLSLTGDEVLRDMLYNGNADYEKGAVVCRVAPSFIRFGNFQLLAARGDVDNLKVLTDYTIQQFYPELGESNRASYLAFFQTVANQSKEMVLNWQRVGFVHGVMNTDNMSILSQTIDYGPYGWLENFDPGWTPNTTDAQHKRYRFGNQPSIVLWNLTQLANALYPLIEDVPALEKVLEGFRDDFQAEHLVMRLSKLGLFTMVEGDDQLMNELEKLLYRSEIDMTLFFRDLNKFDLENRAATLDRLYEQTYMDKVHFQNFVNDWTSWINQYAERLKVEEISDTDRIERMNKINPKYVLRNYMAQLAIDAADNGDYSIIDELFQLLKQPYDEQPENEKWFVKRPEWAKEKIGCSMLSCSS